MQSGSLSAVAADSPTDAWAVGDGHYGNVNGPLAEHWDGVRWTIVPTAFTTGGLTDVTADRPDDAWALGWRYTGRRYVYLHHSYPAQETVLEHWDGRAWNRVRVAQPKSIAWFDYVRSDRAGGIWALGAERTNSTPAHYVPPRYVLLYWDGTSWQRSEVPHGYSLHALAAVSADDVWLVGENTNFDNSQGIAMHFAAGRWHVYHLRRPPATRYIELHAVTAVNRDDIRVVGWAEMTPGDGVLDGDTWGLTFRWHSGEWTRRTLDGDFASFDAVAARFAKEVWIADNDTAGLFLPSQLVRAGVPVRYTAYSHVPAAGTLEAGHVVEALAADREKDLWAVGYIGTGRTPYDEYQDPDYAHFAPLIERYAC